MWRLTVFFYLLIIYGHTSSQLITNDAENGRQTRQLDFGECCPCPGAGDAESSDISTQESSRHPSEHMFARARDLDDCPCRNRHPDSEGASSILFPSSMRSDGPVVRLIEKNEEPKPLLHPEVDLASSVLQTLHEATDEEYQNALARDAARSVAKAAEETFFGDSIPEASTGNMVTIIVKPKHTNSLHDITPQENHVQESRCVNTPPLKGIRKKIGITRATSKPPSLVRKMFGLPKINNPLEMDSSIGPSNFNEHVEHNDGHQSSNRGAEVRSKLVPFIKSNLDYENIASLNMNNNVENKDSSIMKVPNFKLFSLHDKLNDMLSSRSSMDNRKSYLPFTPNLRENNSFKRHKSNSEDQNLSLDTKQIQMIDKKNFFRGKPHLENVLRNTRPDFFKNFLKLKDAEVIPIKERVAAKQRNINVPLLKLPAIFNKETDTPAFTIFKKKENIEMLPKSSNSEIFDHVVSPNNVIEQFSGDNCDDEVIKTTGRLYVKDTNDEISSTDIIDTEPSPSNIQSTVTNRYTDFDKSYSHKFVNSAEYNEVKSLPGTETNLPQTTDSCLHNEAQRSNEDVLNVDNINNAEENQNRDFKDKLNAEDCFVDKNETDSLTDSSDNLNNIVKSTENMSQTSDDSLVSKDVTDKKEKQANDNFKTLDSIMLHSLEKSLSSLKQNIIKKLEDLENHKSVSRNPNTFDKKNITDNIKHKETAPDTKTKSNTDCESENLQQNKESTQISTLKPEDLENAKESSNEISMQDLQKISDSMLQQEEQKRESETAVCSEPIKEVIDSEMPLRDNSREIDTSDTEQSANTQNEIQIEPTNFVDNNNDEEKNCQSNLPNPADVNVEASDIVMNKVSTYNNILESPVLPKEVLQPRQNHLNLFKNPFPDMQDVIKIGPLPTLDDITQRLSSLFDKSDDVEPVSGPNVDFMTRSSSDIGSPIMETDESTNYFQSRFPFLKLEDVNFDILQVKPPSNFLSKIPNIDLHSYKTKLPIPKDLRFKPIKLQSALEDKGSILGAIVTLGQSKVRPNTIHKVNRVSKNLWEDIPNLNDKTRVHKVINFPQKPHNLIDRLSDFSDNSNIWQKVQHGLESRIKEAIKNPIKQQSPNFFEIISTNHEDLNDKLKAIHIDLNDRIETMRNHFKDKFELGPIDTYNRKANVKSFSGFNNQNKERSRLTGYSKPAPKRESKNTLNRRLNQQRQSKIEFPQKLRNHQKYNMSPSANVPIPRTIKVPELKTTLTKSQGAGLQRTSGTNRNEETLPPKTSSVTFLRRTGNTLRNNNSPIGKQINVFKDSKIKVSFSTTQRPPKLSLSDVNTAKNRGKFRLTEDHNESPSELRHSLTKPQIFYDVVNSDLERPKNRFNEQILQRKEPSLGREKNLDGEKTQGNSLIDFKPRSQIIENPFLLKVKEAVKTTILNQLSQVNSPSTLKNSDVRSDVDIHSCLNNEDDMSRSASENTDVVERPTLKENVTYKCKMVCTNE